MTGPFDLAKQMGVERGGDEHEAAIQRTLKAAHVSGKKAAIFCEFTNEPLPTYPVVGGLDLQECMHGKLILAQVQTVKMPIIAEHRGLI
jgi:hypothetical protein